MMRVCMYPSASKLPPGKSNGIAQTIIKYHQHLPKFNIEIVENASKADLIVSHAATMEKADVHHSHGLMWTEHDPSLDMGINATLVRAIKQAKEVTVPSEWVAEVFQRDMKFTPHIIPHGIDCEEWQHNLANEGYILWGKNRTTDGIDPQIVASLAEQFSDYQFVTTFHTGNMPSNVEVIGVLPHHEMKVIIQQAALMLSTTKETFGIMNLEALAAGTPVLGLNCGSVLVRHGLDGYNYSPYAPIDDLFDGLNYCLTNRSWLSDCAKDRAKQFSWEAACRLVANVYQKALTTEKATVAVVIPTYNYGHKVKRAILSALNQSYSISQVIVVDDGSTDNTRDVVMGIDDKRIVYVYQDNAGVAEARNKGFAIAKTKYVVPLDADDAIEREFVSLLVQRMEEKPYLGVAYTGIKVILKDGTELYPERREIDPWPGKMNFDKQLAKWNQVPTCCMVRKKHFDRVGGYKGRYCPNGAGSEDAELWLRMGEYGYNIEYVQSVDGARFIHYSGDGNVSGAKDYVEVDWTAWHPWTRDNRHLFASMAIPGNLSHPVRYYDEPLVSVIIPVGPGHEKHVTTALDSLEAQTLRRWEAIVVWDSDKEPQLESYPYVKLIRSDKRSAGASRNLGVKKARAMLIAYLDADDWYAPQFLEECYLSFQAEHKVIYTDFYSKLTYEQHKEYGGNIVKKGNGYVIVNDSFDDFDCDLAMKRPSGERPYVWTGITIFLPKKWHVPFDEKMETWEDCDYLLRLAWNGHCFHHLAKPLWVYDFSSGMRREKHTGKVGELMGYLQEKYDGMQLQ